MQIILTEYFDMDVIEAGRKLLGETRRLRVQTDRQADRLTLTGRFADSFNFVDRARVVLDAGEEYVISARCDCGQGSFCAHCAALLLRLQAQEPEPATSLALEEGTTAPEEENLEALPGAEPGDRLTVDEVGYSFCNSQKDLYPDAAQPEIPLKRFQLMFGSNLFAKQLYKRYKAWGGSCFGMSSSAGLFLHPGNNVSASDFRRRAGCPRELSLKDVNRGWGMTLHSFVEAMHIAQISQQAAAFRNQLFFSTPLPEKLAAVVEAVKHTEATGTAPLVLDVWENSSFDGGHTVFPFRYEQLDQTHSRLHIYDPNWPGTVRYCCLDQDQEGNYISWRFPMFDSLEYNSRQGGVLSYVPHEIYQDLWDHRAAPAAKALLSTDCDDLTLEDSEGNAVLKLAAGTIKALRKDVVPVFVTDGRGSGEKSVWLNPGSYRVVNDAPERQNLSLSFTTQEGGLELETEASEAEITLDDQQDVQQVKLPGEEKPFLVRLLNTVNEILVRGIGSAVGTVLGTALKSPIFGGLTTGQVTAFQIDGEDADIAGYLPQELSDEEVEGQVSTNSKTEPDKEGTSKAQHRERR